MADKVSDIESIVGFEQKFDKSNIKSFLLFATKAKDNMAKKRMKKKPKSLISKNILNFSIRFLIIWIIYHNTVSFH